jgi:SAM-dependent methyltransferase
MTAPVPAASPAPSLSERLAADEQARRVVRAALGRFDPLLGGLPGVRSQVGRESLEQAFEVPGAPWIVLDRFEWPKYALLPDLAPQGECLLDLGCGYGPSSAPFLAAGKVKTAIGVDENLLFLLLFRRYAEEMKLGEVGLVCHDVGRIPLPVADGTADTVVGSSFFNHFACLRSQRSLRSFFRDLARLSRPGGTLLLDMVPNRQHPFPTEINLGEVIAEPSTRGRALAVLRKVPTRWLPGRVTVTGLWSGYRAYLAVRRRPALGLAAFKREVGKAMPESALGGLPFRTRSYGRLAEGFSGTELFDESKLYGEGEQVRVNGAALGVPYLILRATR